MQQAYLSSHNAQQRGFTLIELIMVIVMLGILAVFAAPRMFNSGDFYARGFHDETLALLRYAQKTAIAQRRTVCVAFTGTSASLTIASNSGDVTCPSGAALNAPNGERSISSRSGVSFNGATNFYFDGLGQPSPPQSIQIYTGTAAAGNPIVVEAQTGYVHD